MLLTKLSAKHEFVAPLIVPTFKRPFVANVISPLIVPPANGKYCDREAPLSVMTFPDVPLKAAKLPETDPAALLTILSAVRELVAPLRVPTFVKL